MNRLTFPLLAFSLIVVAGCGDDDDAKRAESIGGVWRNTTSETLRNKAHTYIFKSNGEMEVQWGREHPSVKELVEAQKDSTFTPTETGTWRIKKGWLRYEINNCNLTDHQHAPRQYWIVKISDDQLEFDAADGRQTYFRVKD